MEMYLRKLSQLGKSFPPDFLSTDFLVGQAARFLHAET